MEISPVLRTFLIILLAYIFGVVSAFAAIAVEALRARREENKTYKRLLQQADRILADNKPIKKTRVTKAKPKSD